MYKIKFIWLLFNLMHKSKVFSYEDNDVNINTFLKQRNVFKKNNFIFYNQTYIPMPRIKLAQLLKRT